MRQLLLVLLLVEVILQSPTAIFESDFAHLLEPYQSFAVRSGDRPWRRSKLAAVSQRRRNRVRGGGPGGLRLWLGPMVILGGIALLGFASFYMLDHLWTGGDAPKDSNGIGALEHYVKFDSHSITDAVGGLAGMTAAVLGIVITVVSLLVQLTSERYSGVAQMFLRDRTNVVVMAYYVVTGVVGVALSLAVHEAFVPRATVLAMMGATAFGLLIMLPYFAYVFRFLEPVNLVARIEREAVRDLIAASRDAEAVSSGQAPALIALEELTDITSNSISGKDKIIASRAVDAIKDLIVGYLAIKKTVHDQWFTISDEIRDNPDFVAMDAESLRDIEADKMWLEWKALRQYLGIYAEAQSAMPDINYLIAIDTRYIGEAALARADRNVVELVFRFMNSYLRAALNARAVRTAYNVLNQYRLLVESMIKGGAPELAIEGVRHMIYYGRTSYDMQLGFVTETVAYDVGAVCEFAHTFDPDGIDLKTLDMFLELDQPLRLKRQESGLQGIRKAQIKLACYYLATGADARARQIADDMAGEDRERLAAIRDQLTRVETKAFWEVIDRGRNFEYMPKKQKDQLGRFFDLLPEAPTAAPVVDPVD
ncbi:MAG: DUF2254 domain-containing protein [Proteobacteria bacterium]|nr:DUF2254 domain-containing protein [Pseudomonadota bacterium]